MSQTDPRLIVMAGRIQELIKMRGLNQKKLERQLGLGDQRLSKMLGGRAPFRLTDLFMILDAIGEPLDVYFTQVGQRLATQRGDPLAGITLERVRELIDESREARERTRAEGG